MQTAELVALPLRERLMAMEALWESLCTDASHAPSVPDWHKGELKRRIAAIDAGQVGISPWEEAKVRIRDGSKARGRLE